MYKRVSFFFHRLFINQLKFIFNFANKYGHYKSMRECRAIDKNDEAIPWYTYPAIEYLNNLDFSKKQIFEYGSGNSSIYWGKKSKNVTSVEHNSKWHEMVSKNIHSNQKLLLVPSDSRYEKSIFTTNQKYDVIVIDAERRAECASLIKNALNLSSDEGCMVIFDNSDRYSKVCKVLRENLDFIQIDFHGFGPINYFSWTTSIFFSRNFSFPINESRQPHFSKASLKETLD